MQWIPGQNNIADALTKINLHTFKLLNEVLSSGILDPIWMIVVGVGSLVLGHVKHVVNVPENDPILLLDQTLIRPFGREGVRREAAYPRVVFPK